MARLWTHDAEGHWAIFPLPTGGALLTGAGPEPRNGPREDRLPPADAAVIQAATDGPWLLVAGSRTSVAVNGQAVALRLKVLRDRDEICVIDQHEALPDTTLTGRRFFLSTEEPPSTVACPDSGSLIKCGRCHNPIHVGSLAVRCPTCGLWFHQTAERSCWTYTDQCPHCAQATALDADVHWSPEAL